MNAVVELRPTDVGPIEYARIGRGPAVLLVHGTPGSYRQLLGLASDLAERFTSILPSRPGYGTTPISAGRTFEEQAAAYAALLRALHIPDAAVVGVSGGGPSALAFARSAGARSLVLCCAVAPHLADVPLGMRLLTMLGPAGTALGSAARTVQRRRARGKTASVILRASLTEGDRMRLDEPGVADALDAFVAGHADAPPGFDGLRNDVRRLTETRDAPDLSDLSLPVLVQHGDEDPTVAVEHARFHAAAIAGARLDVYQGSGHLYLVTRRREATSQIRSFLETST